MKTLVSAGDLEKYAYCPLSWWLSRNENISASADGIKSHKVIEGDLEDIIKKEGKKRLYEKWVLFFATAASLAAILGMALISGFDTEDAIKYVFIIFSLLWLLNSAFFLYKAEKIDIAIMRPKYEKIVLISAMGALFISAVVIILSLPKNEGISRFLAILSLLWIASANVFYYYSMYISENIMRKKIKYVRFDEDITYIGKKDSKELTSAKFGLRGKPDYIIKKKGDYIPVEEKTGRVPKGPHFSHMIQIIAYCMLVEDALEKKPSYGILKYAENLYRITYDKNLQQFVLQFRKSILDAVRDEEAHRNHDRKGKCINCSRRQICPERLA